MIALVDCNNFYVSCERVFQPSLEGKPVGILSNNDGCIIARSEEIKKLGVAMGTPYFKIPDLIKQHNIKILSSNYALYGDMSRRVMQVLGRFTPTMEVYSIDECFLDLSGFSQDLTTYSNTIAKTVKQGTGIPVSIGIAPTKTLAKLANKLAKKGIAGNGSVLVWNTLAEPDKLLATLPVKELWGISSGLGKRLNRIRIDNVLALKQANIQLIRKQFGVVLERMVRELNEIPCIPLEMIAPKRKQILTSRSFGTRLSTLPELRAAVSVFATRSAEKLRSQNLCTQTLCVFIHTSPFALDKPSYNNAITISLDQPTQDTGLLIRTALAGLERIYRPGYEYQRAGILLPDLMPNGMQQLSLFQDDSNDNPKSERLMTVLDAINHAHGRHSIRYASQGLSARWQMRQQLKSPAYTTRWECLPIVTIN
ncbi:MAG: Y-family DNA polymerase [Methylococcaceae bacterium]|nr:Y-family DNA polymerase [Methylococcaceae bacterium]